MIELLEFMFADITHFLGMIAILLILVYGVINFRLFTIVYTKYYESSEEDEED